MFVWVVPILLMLSESVQCLVHSSWGKPESKHVITWKPLMGLQAHSREIQPFCRMSVTGQNLLLPEEACEGEGESHSVMSNSLCLCGL